MSDVQSIKEIVSSYFAPFIAPLDKAEPGKSVGILVGVTIDGVRYYFPSVMSASGVAVATP